MHFSEILIIIVKFSKKINQFENVICKLADALSQPQRGKMCNIPSNVMAKAGMKSITGKWRSDFF